MDKHKDSLGLYGTWPAHKADTIRKMLQLKYFMFDLM